MLKGKSGGALGAPSSDQGRDLGDLAIAPGTARVITSAALIMISVFGAFVLSDGPDGKLFGVGLAVAVLIDATLVRVVLVPATMSLVGRANWWLPGWLDRILPHLDLEGGHVTESDDLDTEPESGSERELVLV